MYVLSSIILLYCYFCHYLLCLINLGNLFLISKRIDLSLLLCCVPPPVPSLYISFLLHSHPWRVFRLCSISNCIPPLLLLGFLFIIIWAAGTWKVSLYFCYRVVYSFNYYFSDCVFKPCYNIFSISCILPSILLYASRMAVCGKHLLSYYVSFHTRNSISSDASDRRTKHQLIDLNMSYQLNHDHASQAALYN